jgi:tetratricopeptide (TPR) repeat protein
MIGQQPPPKNSPRAYDLGERWRTMEICLALAAMTFAVFGQTLRHGFLHFDDNAYVFDNVHVTGGLSLRVVAWVFSHADCFLYHPLTMLSLMCDYQFHGLHAGWYHLTNVLLHTASVILLFLILRQMTGAMWRSAFVAAVFAIHPLRVESVAWVAERKDVLSGLFFMLTIGAYVRYARRPPSLARYLVVVAAFVSALLSKPTVVTLPFVLLLLDYWPLNRFGPGRKLSGLILEKIPLLALAAATCVINVLTAEEGVAAHAKTSILSRLGNAVVSYAVYLRGMVWPAGLAAFYPQPAQGHPFWTIAFSFLLLALITGAVLAFQRKRRWLLTGWLWYLGMLAPMIGLVQAGTFAHADRMTYLPQIGIYMALAWLAAEWGAKWPAARMALAGLMTGVLVALMVCAGRQTEYWQNGETLWTHALACTTDNDVAHFNLGNAYQQKGETDQAMAQYQNALQINPGYAEAQYNIGDLLLRKGRLDEAMVHFQKAVQIEPDYAQAHYTLGIALWQTGRTDEAIASYQRAVQLRPDYADAHYNLGTSFLQQGKMDEAILHFQKALEIKPDNAQADNNLGAALQERGRLDEAIASYRKAAQLRPDYADAQFNLGRALLQKGRVDEAISHLQEVVQMRPDDAEAHGKFGNALCQKGRIAEGMSQLQQALQINPADVSVQNNLAWLLATCSNESLRDGNKAVELARQANEMSGGKSPAILGTLAAAFAEAGQFGDAVGSARKAMALAQAAGKPEMVRRLNSQLQFYEAGRPFHEP